MKYILGTVASVYLVGKLDQTEKHLREGNYAEAASNGIAAVSIIVTTSIAVHGDQ